MATAGVGVVDAGTCVTVVAAVDCGSIGSVFGTVVATAAVVVDVDVGVAAAFVTVDCCSLQKKTSDSC